MLSIASGVVLAAAAPELGYLASLGVGAVIVLLLIFGLVQAGLSVFYARSLNSQLSQGIQAIVGVNNIEHIDRAMEDQRRAPRRERDRGTEDDGSGGK